MKGAPLGNLSNPLTPHPGADGSCLQDQYIRWRPHLPADPGLLQEKLLDACTLDHPAGVKVDVDVLPEAARVVVSDRLGVSEG